MDDQMSGYKIVNNTFINVQMGVFLGGGRHNQIEDNSFTDCDTGINFDNRGLTWDVDRCVPGGAFEEDLLSFNYTQDPWLARYPTLPNIFADPTSEKPCTPMHKSVSNNTFCGVRQMIDLYEGVDESNTVEGNGKSAGCPDDDL